MLKFVKSLCLLQTQNNDVFTLLIKLCGSLVYKRNITLKTHLVPKPCCIQIFYCLKTRSVQVCVRYLKSQRRTIYMISLYVISTSNNKLIE